MSQQLMLKKSVIAVALTLGSSHVVRAQQASPAVPVPRVVITGSYIQRIDAETATPLQVIKRDEISRLGVNSARELVETMTASTGSLSDIGGSNSFAGGASSASLRNLGKQSTLILVNSRRVAPFALADYSEVFTNLDSLPIEAIERVEVLRSGGSAQYGSDAVAGVINIITTSDYQGLTARAAHESSVENNKLRQSTASLTGGVGSMAKDGYNVLANLELFKRGRANWRESVDDINPAYGAKFGPLEVGSGQMFGQRGAPSTLSYPGNLLGQGALPGCTTVNAAGLCVYDRFRRFEMQPEAERANLLVSGKLRINDKLEAFSELLYATTTTTYQSPFANYDSSAGITAWGNPATGAARTFDSGPVPAGHPLNHSGEDLDLLYRFADDPGYRTSKSSQYRALAGLKGQLGKFDWESAVGFMGSKSHDRARGGFFSVTGFTEVIGTPGYDADGNLRDPQFFNRAYQLGKINDAATVAKLFPENGYDGRITQQFWDGRITGVVGQLRGLDVSMAVGADVRHEKFLITPTANLLAGDIVANGAASADAARTSTSAFAEIEVPFSRNLNVTGAARVDKFPGFGAHVSPKLAMRWEASRLLLVRGTVETGFRAPNLTESATSSKYSFSETQDPRRCPQARAYAADLRAQSDALPDTDPLKALSSAKADVIEGNECFAGVSNIVHNNPDLKPEVSHSATFGFVLEPAKGYSLSLDYWNIRRKDEIAVKSNDELLAAEAQQASGVINRLALAQDPSFTAVGGGNSAAIQQQYGVTAGALASINGSFLNVSQTRTSGIDLGATARIASRLGRWDLSLNATRLIDFKTFYAERNGGSFGDNLAGRYGFSKTVANFTAALQTGKLSNSLRFVWNSPTALNGDYFDDQYTQAGCADRGWTGRECRIASYVRTDYNLSYTGFKDVTLSAHVGNVFNRRPPIDYRGLDESGGGLIPQSVADIAGRTVRLSMSYKFK
jgi:iron complex outermembrane receptor protein